MERSLAIFDLDNTLIGGDSDHAWGEFIVNNGYVDASSYRQQNDQFYRDYQSGNLDIIAYQEFALQPLSQYTNEQLQQMHAQFMQSYIKPMLLPKAQALVEAHRAKGHCLLIITATNRFITEPIANLLGITNLIATDGEIQNGMYTGKIEGTPSFGEGKITRLNSWLADCGEAFQTSSFYSDSHNDLPLLNKVTNPVAVDPDSTLRSIAEAKAWPILSLRD